MKIKNYDVICCIGQGSFGKVYKGVDVRNDNTVAIKIDTSNLKVLLNEVSIMNYLYRNGVHDIPKIFWYGNIDNNLILIMTHYKNNVQDYFDARGIINDRKLASIMIKCLDILRQVANLNVVHRDVKPENFMMNDGDLNLIDFGLSTIYDFTQNECDIDYKTDIVGTPRFTSYYSHCGEPTSPRDDLISLGYMYIYLNTGSLNWDEIERQCTSLSVCDINHPDNLIRRERKSPVVLIPTLSGSIKNYLRYCYSLKCDDTPDYHSLMRLFTN
jgi:serine/threonine protein kinase